MIIKTCLRCGSYFLRGGRSFTVHCIEGRAVEVSICRGCAKSSVGTVRRRVTMPHDERRAA
jgi:hypothetical protein